MKATIIIPTFWRGHQNGKIICSSESDYIYDNATPLDQEGTLSRALNSISILDSDDDITVAVIAVPTRRELNQAVQLKVESIIAQHEYKFPIFFIGPDTLVRWRHRLHTGGNTVYDEFLSLGGYAKVYNLCLLAGVLTDADAAIFFKDDAVYDDPDYLRKALEFIGSERDGKMVAGIAGHCRLDGGGYLRPPAQQRWQQLWGDYKAMNEAYALADQGPRLTKTPFALSGNMVVHRNVFEKVPFDPRVPRGVAEDYLMNARFMGFDFFLDNQLGIKRMIKESCVPSWYRLRKDITRFCLGRAKLRYQPKDSRSRILAEDFDPYPGRFLKDDLHDLVLHTSLEMASDYLLEGKESEARESMSNIAISKAEGECHNDPFSDYLNYQDRWQKFINNVPSLKIWLADGIVD